MKKFDLEKQFDFYLEKVNLKKENLSEIQLQETKRAFYAGIAQMWKMFCEIGEMKEENCDAIFNDIDDQLAIFWLDETITTDFRNIN
jgi:hypothetical protein